MDSRIALVARLKFSRVQNFLDKAGGGGENRVGLCHGPWNSLLARRWPGRTDKQERNKQDHRAAKSAGAVRSWQFPIFDEQSRHAAELRGVMRHHRAAVRDANGGDL